MVRVTESIDREFLEDMFFQAADRAMRAAGWMSACEAPYVIAPIEGRYFRLGEGLLASVATLEYVGAHEEPPSATRHVEAWVGVTFPAAERLLAALGAPCTVQVSEDAGVAVGAGEFRVEVTSQKDVDAAVRDAVTIVGAGAPAFAPRAPDIDALIAMLLDEADEYAVRAMHPAILAAAGRVEDARHILGRYRAVERDRDFDAFCDEFERFLNQGANPPPPSDEAFPRPQPLTSHTIHIGWTDIKPGHRLRFLRLMTATTARAITRSLRRGEADDDQIE